MPCLARSPRQPDFSPIDIRNLDIERARPTAEYRHDRPTGLADGRSGFPGVRDSETANEPSANYMSGFFRRACFIK